MDRHEADLTDVVEQLGSIYELLAGAEDRAIERHRELLKGVVVDGAEHSYSDTSDVVKAIEDGNKHLQKIARNTG